MTGRASFVQVVPGVVIWSERALPARAWPVLARLAACLDGDEGTSIAGRLALLARLSAIRWSRRRAIRTEGGASSA